MVTLWATSYVPSAGANVGVPTRGPPLLPEPRSPALNARPLHVTVPVAVGVPGTPERYGMATEILITIFFTRPVPEKSRSATSLSLIWVNTLGTREGSCAHLVGISPANVSLEGILSYRQQAFKRLFWTEQIFLMPCSQCRIYLTAMHVVAALRRQIAGALISLCRGLIAPICNTPIFRPCPLRAR